MSIYSGFGTRQEESAYNSLVESTIKLLQAKVSSNLKNDKEVDPLFKIHLLKNYEMMIKLEKHKYLDPKFSDAIRDVVVKIVKDQVSIPLEKSENLPMRKSFNSTNFMGSVTERSITPTLPVVKTQVKYRTHTPIRDKSDTGFLFARLKKNY